MNDKPYVVTISHQIGSGGAYIGQKLSELLGIPFLDREILKKVADQLNLAESELEHRQERLSSMWQSFSRIARYTDPAGCLSADSYVPSDEELFKIESETISRVAEKRSAIIIGRCGWYVLRNHPRRVSLLVHAEMPARIQRASELYCLSEAEAEKLIKANDKERGAYIRTFTHHDWLDARLYDLCANSTQLGLDTVVELAMACIKAKVC